LISGTDRTKLNCPNYMRQKKRKEKKRKEKKIKEKKRKEDRL